MTKYEITIDSFYFLCFDANPNEPTGLKNVEFLISIN